MWFEDSYYNKPQSAFPVFSFTYIKRESLSCGCVWERLLRARRRPHRTPMDSDASGSGAHVSGYAICISGELRAFWTLRHNFERALVEPNGPADVFAHLYLEPHNDNHAQAVQWLRQKPWLLGIEVETFDAALEARIVSEYPHFDALNFSSPTASRIASMQRKIMLADGMRRRAEQQRGKRYRAVVRTRFDLVYGAPVHLSQLGPLEDSVLFTPLAPPSSGTIWRMCDWWAGLNAMTCGDLGHGACVESPMLSSPDTAALARCQCCGSVRNRVFDEDMCGCSSFMSHGGGWDKAHLLDQIAIGTSEAMSVYSSLHDHAGRLLVLQPQLSSARLGRRGKWRREM